MTERSPTVTAIIVFLNAETFLGDAVESVFAQTYDDWELLLVDDGSTDGSTRIAAEYAGRHPDRVRYLEHDGHENLGISASRNLGIRHARGEFIALLDADDVWLQHKLADQVKLLRQYPDVAMVYGNSRYWYSWQEPANGPEKDFQPILGFVSKRPVEPPGLLLAMLVGGAAVPVPSSVLIRTEHLLTVGCLDESFTGMYEDQALYAKLALRYSVLPMDTCWDLYRQHEESVCSTSERSGTLVSARRTFLEWVEALLKDFETVPKSVTRALDKAKWRLEHPKLAAVGRRTQRLLGRGRL